MPRDVDGFLLPVPKNNLAAYCRMARTAGKVGVDHGALEYRECVGEDVTPTFGVPPPRQMRLKDNEVAVFSWIVYQSRRDRDRVNAAVGQDPRMAK